MKIEETIQKNPNKEPNTILLSKLNRISILINFKNKNTTEINDAINK
jgi:hypothetical protein